MIVSKEDMDTIEALAAKLVDQLMEAGCDSVRVIITAKSKNEQTQRMSLGAGNYYAQLGSVREWLERDSAQTLANEVSCAINRPDDGDGWK
jgi:hypothetical protein